MKISLMKIGAVVGGFIAGAASVVVILQWYEAPTAKLRANFEANSYEAAPIKNPGRPSYPGFGPNDKPPVDTAKFAKPERFSDPNPALAFLHGQIRNEGTKE